MGAKAATDLEFSEKAYRLAYLDVDAKVKDGTLPSAYAQRCNSSGFLQGTEFKVNSYTSSTQRNSSVASDSQGNFIVTWQSNGQDGSSYGIYAQRYKFQ